MIVTRLTDVYFFSYFDISWQKLVALMNFIPKIMKNTQNNLVSLRIMSTARFEILTAMITKAGPVAVFYPEDGSKNFLRNVSYL